MKNRLKGLTVREILDIKKVDVNSTETFEIVKRWYGDGKSISGRVHVTCRKNEEEHPDNNWLDVKIHEIDFVAIQKTGEFRIRLISNINN